MLETKREEGSDSGLIAAGIVAGAIAIAFVLVAFGRQIMAVLKQIF